MKGGFYLNTNQSTFSRLFFLASEGRWKLVLSCTLMTIGTLCGMIPYVSVYMITRELLMGEGEQNFIILWSLIALISLIFNGLLTFLGSLGAHKIAFRVLYGIRVKVMEHLGKLSMGFFTSRTTGSVQKTMDESIEKIEIFIAHLLPDLFGSAFAVLALLMGLGTLNIWLAIAVVVAIIGALLLQMFVWGGNRGQDILTGLASMSGRMTGAFGEYVKGIAEVKLFGLTGMVTKGLDEATNKYGTWEVKLYKRSAPYYSGYKTIILSLLSVVLLVGTLLIYLNPTDPMIYLSVIMGLVVTPAVFAPLMELVTSGARMGEMTIALKNIDNILDLEPISKPYQAKTPKCFDIEFKNVSFSYQSTADPTHTLALDNVNFTAKQNSMTALVGPSGGGKSTIGQLTSRFWDTSEGAILIGDVDIRDIDPNELMNLVSYVFQDTYIFSDTVFGNISMNRETTEEQVEIAAKQAQCHEFIMTLPEGYKTKIGSGGVGLSGGEAQRLAIARAMFKNSPIVVLDEALAYSDAENENLIQRAIDKLIESKTVIIIAHRLPSIKNAEQILVLDKGKIVEEGNHESLMKSDTIYRELWNIQNEVDNWTITKESGASL